MTEAAGASAKGKRGPPRSPLLLLAALLLLASLLRLAGLSWGLPDERHYFSYHPDEAPLLFPALTISQGDWNPHFFNYGTLYIYLVALPARVLGLAPGPLPEAPLYLLARLLSALFGVASVYLLFRLGSLIGGGRLGLLSAAILALLPLHLVLSHYATVDAASVFFLLLAAIGWAKILRDGSWGGYLLAGAATGAAAAAKYSLAVALVMLPVAALLSTSPRPKRRAVPARALRLAAALAAAGIAFLLGCPYALSLAGGLHLNPEFVEGFRFELTHMRQGGTFAFLDSGSGWAYHFFRGLPAGLGLPLLALALAGFLPLARRQGRAGWLMLAWCGLYFLVIGFARERFIRYLLPLAPFLALSAAEAALRLWQARRLSWVCRLATIGALALTACYSAGQLSLLTGRDPRDRAADWVAALAPPPSSIGLAQAPWFFTPPVTPFNGGNRSRRLFEEWNREHGHCLLIIGWDAPRLRRLNPKVFLLADIEYRDLLRLGRPEVVALLGELESRWRRRSFEPSPLFPWVGLGKAQAPPDWQYACPRIDVYYSPELRGRDETR
jgi:4-amino-4-deoxy-L-arabinose transferase-like glycosyltransferase